MKEAIKSLADFPIPDSNDIERQVLADAVSCPETIGELSAMISVDMFTSDERRHIWEMILWMRNSRLTIDLVSVQSRVGKHFITEVVASGFMNGSTATDTMQHARLLRDAASRRKAYYAAIGLLEASSRAENTEVDIFAESEKVAKALQENTISSGVTSISEVVNKLADEIQERERLEKEGSQWRVPTGFYTLDNMTFNGWGPGQLIVLAARPSVGKTAVMLQMAKNAAQSGFPTMVFSLEMTELELGRRLMASTGYISQTEMMIGKMDWVRYESAAGKITPLPIIIDDKSRHLSDIIAKLTINAERGLCKVGFIDYLGLIKERGSEKLPVYQLISLVTSELKAVAKRLGIPIILLAQLNRESSKEGRAPQLYDLRDSGSIEQDADVVLMMEQVKGFDDDDKNPDINIWVRKNRQYRKEACITVRPDNSYASFTEIGAR